MKILALSFLVLSTSLMAEDFDAFENGEVKIMYPCSVQRELSLDKEERETITFFEREQNEIGKLGLSFRLRNNGVSQDFTVKYRSSNEETLNPDTKIFRELEKSRNGEVKCETDVSYDRVKPKAVQSCSFTANTAEFLPEHFRLMDMMDVSVSDFDGDLSGFRSVSVKATSWKMKLTDAQKEESPLLKRPSVEKWVFGNECLLEISGKFEAPTKPREGLNFLKNLINAQPSPIQGNKTGRVLGN